MEPFSQEYAEIYDLLYQEKNYQYEVDIIEDVIHKYKPEATNILDYGCGTGNHTNVLVNKGYTIYAIDKSESMLNIAKRKLQNHQNIHFYRCEEKNVITPKSIDVCVTLFDVVSYMTTNEELHEYLTFLHNILSNKGLVIFDFWYGPGVIHLEPEKRWKEYQSEITNLLRLTEPILNLDDCLVNITHQVIVSQNNTLVNRFNDIHTMRFFFKNEIQLLLEHHGFKILKFGTWNDLEILPTTEDWSALVVSQLIH